MSNHKMQSFYSIGSNRNFIVVGTENGEIYSIVNNEVVLVLGACDTKSPILALNTCSDGFISGSKDGCSINS